MAEQYYSPKDNTDFPQIVLKYIDKILEILSKELKNKQTILPQIGSRAEVILEEEDTRQSFVQSIQALTSLLAPWHDKEMKSASEEFQKIVDGTRAKYHKEYKKQVEEEFELQKELKINEYEEATQDFFKSYREWHKVSEGKKMFTQLNELLHSNDYLKGSIYTEG